MAIKVTGSAETVKALKELATKYGASELEPSLLEIARELRDEIKPLTPVGPTGNLRKAIRAKRGRRRGNLYTSAIVLVDRKIAPHLHLVTGGTKAHRIVAKAKRVLAGIGRVFGRSVSHPGAKPNTYFEDAVNARMSLLAMKLEALIRAKP